jgi:hypothetical protein
MHLRTDQEDMCLKAIGVCAQNLLNILGSKGNIIEHHIIKQCAFVHVDPENITMGCPNLEQGDLD